MQLLLVSLSVDDVGGRSRVELLVFVGGRRLNNLAVSDEELQEAPNFVWIDPIPPTSGNPTNRKPESVPN
jgi:hypothetical protein